MIAVVLALGLVGGFLALSDDESTAATAPGQLRAEEINEQLNEANIAIQQGLFDEAQAHLEAVPPLLADATFDGDEAAITTRLEQLDLDLTQSRQRQTVATRTTDLKHQIDQVVFAADLDLLQEQILQHRRDPLGTGTPDPTLAAQCSDMLALLSGADEAITKERARRTRGLDEPAWPDPQALAEAGTSLSKRMARRIMGNTEKAATELLAANNYTTLLNTLRSVQTKHPEIDFHPLWQQTMTALAASWPATEAAARAEVEAAQAVTGAERPQALSAARRALRDLLPQAGHEEHFAILRQLHNELVEQNEPAKDPGFSLF